MNIHNFQVLIASLILNLATPVFGQVTNSHISGIFTRTAIFSFGTDSGSPQLKVAVGQTRENQACVLTQAIGGSAIAFEVVGLDTTGNVLTEPLAYDLSTRRKYKGLVLSIEENPESSQLRLESLQSLGSTAKVSYQIVMRKVRNQVTQVRMAYQNLGGRSGAKSWGGEALECGKMKPFISLSSIEFAARASDARRMFESSQNEKLGSYLPNVMPRCALESSQVFSCEYAYQSQRIPDYLKVTYALTSKGLGRVLNIELTRGH